MNIITIPEGREGRNIVLMLVLVLGMASQSCHVEKPERMDIKIKFDESLFGEDVTGKLIFLFSQDTASSLVYWVDPNKPHPVFTYDLEHWDTEDTLIIDHFTDEWYRPYSQLEGEYAFRVLFDQDSMKRSSFAVRGNGYSDKQKALLTRDTHNPISIDVDHVFNGWVFKDTGLIYEEKFRSQALSQFWGYDMYIESAVLVPEDYHKSRQDYPLVFVFPGFGSNHASITYGTGQIDRYGMNTVGEQKIFVFMNAEFFQGYHHFADSENNGPWGLAFIEEFIPYIEKRYRVQKDPSHRFLMGQSSGAWTAVWLQVNYPKMFEGAFAASPDPLDFRAHAFNIYLDQANFYYPPNPDSAALEAGNKKKLYVQLEHIIGEFGQLRTWEATYSPRLQEGSVASLFDRNSGDIYPEIAEFWKKYDIAKIIANDPAKYRDLLSGKLHLFVARDDPYGLAKSVELLEEVLGINGIDADIQYFTGLGHNVWSDALRSHIHAIMDQADVR